MPECSSTDWKHYAFGFGVLLLEAWLGKTKKTIYSSTIELIIMGTWNLIIKKKG